MKESPGRSWIVVAVLVGVLYAVVGIVFAVPATHVRAWRLGAWAISIIVYGGHIVHERARRREPPRSAALHVAFAAALGAFGLAVGANVHSLSTGSSSDHRELLLLSLAVWPVMTGIPAFLVALGASMGLSRVISRPRVE